MISDSSMWKSSAGRLVFLLKQQHNQYDNLLRMINLRVWNAPDRQRGMRRFGK